MEKSRIAIQILRFSASLILPVLIGIVLVCVLVMLQGMRDEARHVDVIIGLCHADMSEKLCLDHTMRLYHRGYAPRIMLVGGQVEESKTSLISQGLPEAALLVANGADNHTYIRTAASLAYHQGIGSALLVGPPEGMLCFLKQARDLGLVSYGSPFSNTLPRVGAVVQSSFAYWQYVLFAYS